MRHQYTPIFQDVLASRLWAMAPSTRVVWLWFQLRADPDGYVCASTAGVAIGANVTLEAATLALEELTEHDPDADPVQILERAPRGWRVVGFKEQAELVAVERQRARNRRYMATYRHAKAANDAAVDELIAMTTEPSTLPAEPHTEAPPSVTPALPNVTQNASPASRAPALDDPDPVLTNSRAAAADPDLLERAQTVPAAAAAVVAAEVVEGVILPHDYGRLSFDAPVLRTSPKTTCVIPATWLPSQSLRDDATMAGVTNFDERILTLRLGPIGGVRGVFEDAIDDYIRTLFGKWRTWSETDRAKAAAAAAAKPRGQSYRRPGEEAPELVDFDPRYLSTSHSDFCDRAGLGAAEPLAREWRAIAIGEGKALTRVEADKAFARWLGKRAKAKGVAA